MKVYNTLSGQKEEFLPGDPVKIYVCGVTPYAECHIGHAMSYVVFDVIRRYLEFRGYRVKHVQNFTDVDDKIIARARQSGTSSQELAEGFIERYFANMDALNIKRAHLYPRATEEIPRIIEVIKGLIEKGHAYQAGGDVYFLVESDPDYGKLSHRVLDEMIAGARVEVEGGKKHPPDFALWKAAKPDEPQWESPWGMGRPGWHIECSVMSLKYLGDTLDIHGGGQDLIFPHHENEIAQSESFTGVTPFVRYWLHNGLMHLGEEKMSKSSGNLITVREGLERYGADALRLFVLSSHYRSPITYTEEGLEAMQKGVERLLHAIRPDGNESGVNVVDGEPYQEGFIEAMDDDFNTAEAVAALFELAREINRGKEDGYQVADAQKNLIELAEVLGLTLKAEEIQLPAEPFINLLIATRNELRAAKQWELADNIRHSLGELGIALEDTRHGTVWRYKR